MIPTVKHSGKDRTMEAVKRSVVATDYFGRAGGGGKDEKVEHR